MSQINTTKKVKIDPASGDLEYIGFTNIVTALSNNNDSMKVGFDIYLRELNENSVLVNTKKIRTMTDKYSKDRVDSIVAQITIPPELGEFDRRKFIDYEAAKIIITTSVSFTDWALTMADLEDEA